MSNVTKKFTRSYLKDELGLPCDVDTEKATIIEDDITDHQRWSVVHRLVFRLADQPADEAWKVTYSVGATESQGERPWEYEDDVEATLVRLVEKTVKVWEPVAS